MSGNELAALRGRKGRLTVEKIRVDVIIIDSRIAFSRVDVLVTPIAGIGEQWVSLDRVSFAVGLERQTLRVRGEWISEMAERVKADRLS